MMAFVSLSVAAQEGPKIASAKIAMDRGDLVEAKKYTDQADSIIKAKSGAVDPKLVAKHLLYRGDVYNKLYNSSKKFSDLEFAFQAYADLIELEKSKPKYSKIAITESMPGVAASFITEAQTAYDAKDSKLALHLYQSAVDVRAHLGEVDTLTLSFLAALQNEAKNFAEAEKYYKKIIDLDYKGITWTGKLAENDRVATFPDKITLDYYVGLGKASEPTRTPSIDHEYYLQLLNMYLVAAATDKDPKTSAWYTQFDIEVKKAQAKYPTMDDFVKMELQSYIAREKFEEALSNLLASVAVNPSNSLFLYNIGFIYHQKKNDLAKGAEYYDRAIEADPNNTDALYMRGFMFIDASNKFIEKMNALSRSAADQKKYNELEKEKTNELKKAVPFFEKAYQLNPKDRATLEALREVYYKTGRSEDAARIANELKYL